MKLKKLISKEDDKHMLYFYMSPYKRSLQTYEALASQFSPDRIQGCQEEVQLREQDFGNFQVPFLTPHCAVPSLPNVEPADLC